MHSVGEFKKPIYRYTNQATSIPTPTSFPSAGFELRARGGPGGDPGGDCAGQRQIFHSGDRVLGTRWLGGRRPRPYRLQGMCRGPHHHASAEVRFYF